MKSEDLIDAIMSVEAPEAEIDFKSEVIRLSKLWSPPKTDAIKDHLRYQELPSYEHVQPLLTSTPHPNSVEVKVKAPIASTSKKLCFQKDIGTVENAGYLVTEVEHSSYVDMKMNKFLPVFQRAVKPSPYLDMTSSYINSSKDNSKSQTSHS